MGVNVTYFTGTRIIEVTKVPVVPVGAVIAQSSLDVEIDLYSDAKEDWLANVGGTFRGTIFPWATAESAGSPLPGGQVEPAFFRLRNDLGWRLLPYDSDHELTLIGNLVPFDETLPIIANRTGRTILIFRDGSQVAQATSETISTAVDSSVTGGNVVEMHRHAGLDPNNPAEIRDVVPDQDHDLVATGVFVQSRDIGGGVTRLTRIVDGQINIPVGSLSLTGLAPTITIT